MAEFLRPAARAALWQWREALIGVCVAILGLLWGLSSFGFVIWLAGFVMIIGAALIFTGIQRGRFRQNGEGPGVVNVVERRLSYFGPLTGGVMDMGDLTLLVLDPAMGTAPHWVLTGIGGEKLMIPTNAAGAEALFDVFATLPGIKTEKMLQTLSQKPDAAVVIWAGARPLLH